VLPLRGKSLHPSFRIHREIERCHSDTRPLYIALYGVSEWRGGWEGVPVVSSIGIPASAGVTVACTVTCNGNLPFGKV
jgi:hypothetical protein